MKFLMVALVFTSFSLYAASCPNLSGVYTKCKNAAKKDATPTLKIEQSSANGVVTFKIGQKTYVADGQERVETGGAGPSAWSKKYTANCSETALQAKVVETTGSSTTLDESQFAKAGEKLEFTSKRVVDDAVFESKMVCEL